MISKFLKRFLPSQVPVVPMPREKHKWQLVSRSYASPVRVTDGIQFDKLPTDMVLKMMLGVTTYLWECLLTGDTKTEQILGTDIQILDELLVKATQYGPQIIKDDNGNPFILSSYEKTIDPTTLPMRRV